MDIFNTMIANIKDYPRNENDEQERQPKKIKII